MKSDGLIAALCCGAVIMLAGCMLSLFALFAVVPLFERVAAQVIVGSLLLGYVISTAYTAWRIAMIVGQLAPKLEDES